MLAADQNPRLLRDPSMRLQSTVPDCCINFYVLVRETPLYKGYFAHWPVRLRFTPSEDKLHWRDTRFALLLQHELPFSVAFYATDGCRQVN